MAIAMTATSAARVKLSERLNDEGTYRPNPREGSGGAGAGVLRLKGLGRGAASQPCCAAFSVVSGAASMRLCDANDR